MEDKVNIFGCCGGHEEHFDHCNRLIPLTKEELEELNSLPQFQDPEVSAFEEYYLDQD